MPKRAGMAQVFGDDRVTLGLGEYMDSGLDEVTVTAPGVGFIPKLPGVAAVT
jgi:hypothetical protein